MRQFPGYIFDLDGTVYRGSRLTPGADATLRRLRACGARIAFASNNPARTADQYAAKLTSLGIPAAPEDIVTSVFALIEALRKKPAGLRLYVAGEELLRAELGRAGFPLANDPAETDLVILAFDRTFHYGKLLFVHQAAKRGARIWATNPDPTCPLEEGDTPDCGAIIAAVEASTGKKVELVAGKPSPGILEAAARRMGLPLSECLFVGDRLETDIRMAKNAGAPSALVLTGVSTREMQEKFPVQPDYVLESIAGLIE